MMHENDFDDEDKNLGAVLRDGVKVDRDRGTVQVGWKQFEVGRTLAPFVSAGVSWLSSVIYQRGGTLARDWSIKAANSTGLRNSANKIGTGAELAVRIGGPLAAVGAGIAGTVHGSIKQMRELRDDAAVLLAANNDMQSGAGKILNCKYSALCHKRHVIYDSGKRSIAGSLIGSLSQLPALLIGYNQFKLDRIEDPALESDPVQRAKYAAMNTATPIVPPHQPSEGTESSLRGFGSGDPMLEIFRKLTWVVDGNQRESMWKPRAKSDVDLNIRNLGLTPPAVGWFSDILREKFLRKEADRTVAWDQIKDLEDYMNREHRPDRDEVAVMVKKIFQQHARDLGKRYEIDGAGFDAAVDVIASAIQYRKLHPQALAEILDDKKIVKFGKKEADFGDVEDVKDQINALRQKYDSRVSETEFYKDAPFTKESLRATFDGMPEDERRFFVMLIPPGILEKAGVPKDAVKKYRKQGQDEFTGELTEMIRFAIETGREELQKRGVRGKVMDELETLENGFAKADRNENGRAYIEENIEEASAVVRNIMGAVKKPQQLWKEFVASREGAKSPAELQPRGALDHAARDRGDEMSSPEL